ncbi:hypothetical protein T05_12285 [Trichinella murrelli]|uniref:Uncharacterized protein n=1 Tax=Trichinella murrelli TaxID=144512 RepID=A0A0V0TC03_9BILA|nr:hypothetical protein T05_12285 [Trichinella murrelli]
MESSKSAIFALFGGTFENVHSRNLPCMDSRLKCCANRKSETSNNGGIVALSRPREGCPSEAQEDVDWLTATDALVSRAPVGHVDRPGGVWPIRDKEVDRQGCWANFSNFQSR